MSLNEQFQSTASQPASHPDSTSRAGRRALVSACIGQFIEFYDFALYGISAAVLGLVFFPSSDPLTGLLVTFAVFGAAFAMRPLGGFVFGLIGDRLGRRPVLFVTLLTIGLSTALIGLLPPYSALGWVAPLLLVLLRLVQGFSAGGESVGAVTFVFEHAPLHRRGLWVSIVMAASVVPAVFASALFLLIQTTTSADDFLAWGWRIPFLLALPLTVVSFLLRRRLVAAHNPRSEQERTKIPVLEVLSRSPLTLVKSVLFSMAVNGTAYFGLTFISIHMLNRLGREAGETYWITTVVVIIAALLMPLAGTLGDRISLPNLALLGVSGYVLLSVPGLMLINTAGGAVAFIGFLLIMVNTSALQVAGYTLTPQLFERKVRYTGAALGWNIGVVISGGTAPAICVWLVEATGSLVAPAYYVVGLAAVGALAILAIKRSPLPQD